VVHANVLKTVRALTFSVVYCLVIVALHPSIEGATLISPMPA